jgi:hypothetical protein
MQVEKMCNITPALSGPDILRQKSLQVSMMYFDYSGTYPRTNKILFHTQTPIENLLQRELFSKRSSLLA